MSEVVIRRAAPGDGEALAALWIEFGVALAERSPDTFAPPAGGGGLAEWFESRIAAVEGDDATLLAVAERDGAVLALAAASTRPPMEPREAALMPEMRHPRATLEDIVVSENERSKGVGATLFAFVEDWARSRGAVALTLNSDPEGPPRRFYERLGMRIAAAVYHKKL